MRIIIVGAGVIGINLARELSRDHEVYLIEEKEKNAAKASEKLDVKVFTGNGADPSVLTKAPVHSADMVIAVASADETNVTVCALAGAYGAKFKAARVRNASLARAIKKYHGTAFDIDEVISPEDLAADAILKSVRTPGAREVADFANGQILFRVFDIEEESSLREISLGGLSEEDFPWPFLIVAVMRDGHVFFAKGDTVLQTGDRIYVLLPQKSAGEFLMFVNPQVRKYKKAVIYGASMIGKKVAALLHEEIGDVVLIEEDYEQAELAASELKDVRVLHGSALETDILKESGIESADVFIAADKEDQANLVSALLAKKMGAKNTIITTAAPDYTRIVDAIDIDAVFNARFLAVDQILKFVRGKSFSAVRSFSECDAEALELIPQEGAAITRAPLKEMSFPKDAIIGAVFRDNEVILANGNLQVRPGEKVIVFCREAALKEIQRLFVKK